MNIVLTGIPRSGTTLSCHLLNRLPQCVALLEPMQVRLLIQADFPAGYLSLIADFFAEQRASLLCTGETVSRAVAGQMYDNFFGVERNEAGLRLNFASRQRILVEKPLQPDFRLVVKHPNFFTATLHQLATVYPCYAVVRNPLAVLLSWGSVATGFSQGRIPAGEAFDPELRMALESQPDPLERQLTILAWSFGRYASALPPGHVLRYEDLIASGGAALAVVDPAASALALPLQTRNRNPLYSSEHLDAIASRLLADPSIYAPYYSPRDVEALQQAWQSLGPGQQTAAR